MTTDQTPTPTRYPCAFCKEGHEGTAGGSYDRQACEARNIEGQLSVLRSVERRPDVAAQIRFLERRLEQVRYVGD